MRPKWSMPSVETRDKLFVAYMGGFFSFFGSLAMYGAWSGGIFPLFLLSLVSFGGLAFYGIWPAIDRSWRVEFCKSGTFSEFWNGVE